MTTTERQDRKKPYAKPELKVIGMKEEEVLAIGCKLVGGGGGEFQPDNCGIFANCNQTGS